MVYPVEIDLTQTTAPFATAIGACLYASARGPVTPTFYSQQRSFLAVNGIPDPTISLATYSILSFLKQSRMLWGLRVVGSGALYANGIYVNNVLANGSIDSTTFSNLPGTPFEQDDETRTITELVFSGPLITGNVVNITINGTPLPAVNFVGSNNATMNQIAQTIAAQVNFIGSFGTAYVPVMQAANATIVRIISPINNTITVNSAVVTGGISQATIISRATPWLLWVYAENPGSWPNNVATTITNINQGFPQQITLSFSLAFVTGNIFNGTIQGNPIGPVNFVTDNNTTLVAIAAAIQAAFPGSSATPVAVAGTNANRQIIITAPNSLTAMVIASLAVTGGFIQPIVNQLTNVTAIPTNYTFQLNVFENVYANPVESWVVSLVPYINGFGQQALASIMVNNSSTQSTRIRVSVNPVLLPTTQPANITTLQQSIGQGFLTGGAMGNIPTTSQYIAGWANFADPAQVAVRILINGGNSVPAIQQTMDSICQSRKDCFSVLDIPSNVQLPAAAVSYRNNQLNINSSYSAVYTPDVQVYDQYSGQPIFLPPSGFVAAQFAFNDNVAHEWFSPAGLNRGLIPNVQSLAQTYVEGDRDLLSTNQVNAIRKIGPSFPIWGEYTLQVATSDRSSVAVRRLLITIETTLTDALNFIVFEPNDAFTRAQVTNLCNNMLLPIKNSRGLYSFQVFCNNENNPPQVIQVRQLYVTVELQPVLSILYVILQAVLVPTGASFQEVFANLQNGNTVAVG